MKVTLYNYGTNKKSNFYFAGYRSFIYFYNKILNNENLTLAVPRSRILRFYLDKIYSGWLYELEIPEGVTSLDDWAFEQFKFDNITLPNSLSSIGNYAFGRCPKLGSITLPDRLQSIGNFAFAGCHSLRTINIPDSVSNIGDRAFACCPSLTSIYISDPNKNIFNGKTLLQFALGSLNWNLAINSLLEHGNNIKCGSLPANLKNTLFPELESNDNIDSQRVLRHLLNEHYNGKSPLLLAYEKNNSNLAIYSLLKYGNNIKCESLPRKWKNDFFPGLSPEDKIDSEVMLKHLLSERYFVNNLVKECCQFKNSHVLDSLIDFNNSEVLLALFTSHNETAIDNLVRRYIDRGKLHLLDKLIEDNENVCDYDKKDLSLLKRRVNIRSKKYRIHTSKKTGSGVFNILLNSLQSYLNLEDATALYLTSSEKTKTVSFKSRQERQSSRSEMSSSSASQSEVIFSQTIESNSTTTVRDKCLKSLRSQ